MPPLDQPTRESKTGAFPGNHQTHQPPGSVAANCSICHHNATSYTTEHRDGKISFPTSLNDSPATGQYQVNGTGLLFKNQTTLPAIGSCSNINCHFETATPQWGSANFRFDSAAANDCKRCHGQGSSSSAPNDGSHPGTGSKHGVYFGTDTTACAKCHPDHTGEAAPFAHATSAGNRGLLVRFDASPNGGFGRYTGNVAYPDYLPSLHPARNGTCRNLYCHSPGTKASSVDKANVAPVWGSSLPANCTGCHKSDFASNDPMSTGSHARHVSTYGFSKIPCAKCHAATATDAMGIKDITEHVNGRVNIVFNSRTTAINGKYDGLDAPMAKAPGSSYGTCENVYCHSTVQPDGGVGSPTYKAAAWGNNVVMVCGTCHADGSSHSVGSPMSSGSHTKHLDSLVAYPSPHRCGICHNIGGGTFTPDPGGCNNYLCHSGNAARHVNGQVDLNIVSYFGGSAGYSGTPRPGDGYGDCSNVYCHSDGQATPATYAVATWGNSASGACGTCHGVSGTNPPASVRHARHVGSSAVYRYACSKCHSTLVQATADSGVQPTVLDLARHVNKNRDVRFDGVSPFGAYSSDSATCVNIYCHSTGKTGLAATSLPAVYRPYSGGGVYNRPKWSDSGSLGCNACHGRSTSNGMPDYSSTGAPGSANVNSHGKHVASSAIPCSECHEKTTRDNAAIRSSVHVNGTADVFFNLSGSSRGGAYTAGTKTCSSTYCHGIVSAVAWGGNTSCTSCHGASFTTFSSARKGAHARHIQTDAVIPTSYTASGVGNLSADARSYLYGCASCHSPAHAGHANSVTNGGGGAAEVFFGYTSVAMRGTYLSGAIQSYTDNGFKWTAGSGCTTTYCHSNGQGGIGLVGVNWATVASGSCVACHDTKQTGGTLSGLSGKHNAHMNQTANPLIGFGNGFNCVDCHAGTVSGNTAIADKRKHVNKFADFSSLRGGGSASYSNAARRCADIYCHSNGNRGAIAYINPDAWNSSSTLGCNGCHGESNPATGAPDYANGGPGTVTANSHYRHVSGNGIRDTKGCAACHVKTASDTVAGQFKDYTAASYHLNGTPSVNFKALAGKTGTWNGSTCTNTYCHGVGTSAAWGTGTSLPCNSCHSATGTDTYWALNSAHRFHWEGSTLPTSYTSAPGNNTGDAANYRFACSSCHDRGSVHAGGPANESGAAELFFGYTSGTMKGTYVYGTTQGTSDNGFTWSAGSNCNTSYCHSNGQGSPGAVNVEWNAPKGTLGCNGCHGNAMSNSLSGKHAQHVNPNVKSSLGAGNGFGCVNCHAKTLSNGTTIGDKRYHVNKFIDFSSPRGGGGARYDRGSKQCTNIYCHSNGNASAIVYANPPAWNSASTFGCSGCHGTGNATGAPDYSNGGEGTASANSHHAHTRNASGTTVCANCHVKTADSVTPGKFKDYSAAAYHINRKADVNFNSLKAGSTAAYSATTGVCSNVACHGNVSVTWGSNTGGGCLTCHEGAIGSRSAIGPQFSANSHHVQGADATGAHCYQCHWEANADGSINYDYHHSDVSGSPVELVVYAAGARPTAYTPGVTAVRYTADGARTEMAKINTHCLGCHSDASNAVIPFGDGKTPKQYAWDGNSIAARYGNTATTPWGKYSGTGITPKNTVTKALSAHGNATANHGGWNTSETWPDSRNGAAIVLCFDCHNAHGSSVSGITTSYASATTNGGLLKDTSAGKGGYSQSYKPAAGGSSANHNAYGAGAGLCFDCHMTAAAGTTPWGYNATFGATQPILGFMDTPYFGAGTFGRQSMFSYKSTSNMGGHFGASSTLSVSASHSINGLCTPCHDPHGVSPSLGTGMNYAVPLLKGTWLTAPYKEDAAPASDQNFVGIAAIGYSGEYEGPTRSQTKLDTQRTYMKAYRIDQNTFGPGTNLVMNSTAYGVTESDAQFAGLCLNCHARSALTNGTNHTWTSKDRIHESVKGWKTANATIQHKFTCSKCHAPHNAGLPRLMVSNCLDSQHKGRTASNINPVLSGSYRGSEGSGSGRMPGSYSAHVGEGGRSYNNQTFTCHENNDGTQKWNVKTKWNGTSGGGGDAPSVPVLTAEPDRTCSYDCSVTLQWNPSSNPSGGTVQYQVQVSSSSSFATINYTSSWITGTSTAVNLSNGTWYWRVKARDAATTLSSDYSSTDSFLLSRY